MTAGTGRDARDARTRAEDSNIEGLTRAAQVAFSVYLWHPRFPGALYVYDRFLAPILVANESRVDHALATTFERVGTHGGAALAAARRFARRYANDALAKATEAQLQQQADAPAASGRADRVVTARTAREVRS